MKIYVDLDHVDITEYTQIESGEYNTNKINFIFTPEYKDLVKVAIFGCKLDTDEPKFYKIYLSDDSCYLPQEVTTTSDVISIGVYAFNVVGGELKLRYSPTPVKTIVYEGSFREEAENASSPTPTEIEQIMSRIISLEDITSDLNTRVEALENKACDVDSIKEDVEKLKDDVEGISGRLDTVESDIDDLEGDIANTYSKTEVDTLLGAKVDTTTFTESQNAQDEKIAKAELILSQLPKVTGEGSNISLSPTIEYDLEVKSLLGDTTQNTLNGYNLFNKDVSKQEAYITTTVGTKVVYSSSSSSYCYINCCNVEANQTYMISWVRNGTPLSVNARTSVIVDDNDIVLERIVIWENSYTQRTFTPTTSGHLILCFDKNSDTIQIEKGTTKHDYEEYCGGIPSPNPNYPQDILAVTGTQTITVSNSDNTETQTYSLHLGDEELAKIGSYQDKIYYDNGKWYLRKEIGKKTLIGDNSEGWTYYNGLFLLGQNASTFGIKTSTELYSNYFTYSSTTSTNGTIKSGNTYSIQIRYDEYTSSSDFKTWLSLHNTIVNYVLNEATITEITNETLLQDLNYIKEHIVSFSGTTNISTSGNLPIIITASALKQLS